MFRDVRYSGMFDVPGCSMFWDVRCSGKFDVMFDVPGFIDGLLLVAKQ